MHTIDYANMHIRALNTAKSIDTYVSGMMCKSVFTPQEIIRHRMRTERGRPKHERGGKSTPKKQFPSLSFKFSACQTKCSASYIGRNGFGCCCCLLCLTPQSHFHSMKQNFSLSLASQVHIRFLSISIFLFFFLLTQNILWLKSHEIYIIYSSIWNSLPTNPFPKKKMRTAFLFSIGIVISRR